MNYHFNPINNDYMTDLEYIIKQAKKFYYIQWDEAELRKCVCQVFEASERQADRIVAKAIEAEIIERRGRGIYALKRPPQPT